MDEVVQMLDFRLDRRGVVLASMARDTSTILNGDDEPPNPERLIFDGPFLVVLKMRDGLPFFVMHVANAELLYPY